MKWLIFSQLIFAAPIIGIAQSAFPVLTPKDSPLPSINGARIFGVRPNNPVVFQIAASGERPMRFAASGLPSHVVLDRGNGRLSGIAKKPGTYTVHITARNRFGKAKRLLKLVVGDEIALTPPMGWNSYNVFGITITGKQILEQARAMVDSHLVEHGWSYINIDDGWQGSRGGGDHAIRGDSNFTNVKALCDSVHDLGLKMGIYSTPWEESYGGRTGGTSSNAEGLFTKHQEKVPFNKKKLPFAIGPFSFVKSDVRQFANWGIDYLKYDWAPIELPETRLIFNELCNCGRDIVLSLSNSTPFKSIGELSKMANCWRTGGDIKDDWNGIKSRLVSQDKWLPYEKPGHWNDPDMLVVGWVGWGKPRPSQLTANEQYTHISAWCLLSVPLLLGCDLTKLDPFTIGLLTNDEVIEVNQDPLGKQAKVLAQSTSEAILVKDMEGAKAVGLFNFAGDSTNQMTLNLADIGLHGKCLVRDLWRQKDLGTFEGKFSAAVLPHGVSLIKLTQTK